MLDEKKQGTNPCMQLCKNVCEKKTARGHTGLIWQRCQTN